MALVRRIARPLLAAPFIFEGVRTALRPEREIDVYPEAFDAVDSAIGKTSAPGFLDVRTVVRATGVVAAGAGVLYATNRCPRAAAAALLVTTSVGWAGRKRIWELRGEELTQEVQSILTDAGLIGGVLLAVVDHDGKPSLGYRANSFIERSQKKAAAKQRQLEKKAGALEKKAKGAVQTAQKQLSVQQG
ncbi:DoxX family membrane protein [Brachybacterium massiliense]|uniref:DoxX family membrane protein n=1 Tax=Brachybacterium massiliense TaxID=1755098 RepID=UPI000B3BCF79|nr:DoxX family membrane protein [Brachybacterium massiliense]